MKALEYRGPRDLSWRDIAPPELATNTDAIVRPLATATCDLDWQIVNGQTPFPAPFILGHEFAGEVVETGSNVTGFYPGDLVTVAFQPSCGCCHNCGAGESASCTTVAPTSMFGVGEVSGGWGGAFAELIAVPYADNMLVSAPEDVPLTALPSLTDNIADAYRAITPFIRPGQANRVGIFGGYDSIPLYATVIAQSLGVAEVLFCTRDSRAAENAKRLGARVELVAQWPERLPGCDITVCAAQNAKALNSAIRSTRAGGHCTSVSIFAKGIELPLREMYMRGIHFHTGRVNGAHANHSAGKWLVDGLIDPLLVDTNVVTFDELIPALLDRKAAKLVATPE